MSTVFIGNAKPLFVSPDERSGVEYPPLDPRRIWRLEYHDVAVGARRLGEQSCRFDVVGVSLDEAAAVTGVQHLEHAFDLDGWTSGRIRSV